MFRTIMALVLAAASAALVEPSRADDSKYPNWKGEWDFAAPRLPGQRVRFDPNKSPGRAQEAPLTPEYKKVHEDSMADQANGGQGNMIEHAQCKPGGMPFIMAAAIFEFVVTPETTYIMAGTELRRIFTDGRPWPTDNQPTYQGYSIGRWLDEDGDGRYDTLEVETRGPFKGPRVYDASGLPLHEDNESTMKERIFLDKSDPSLMHDVITVFDHALTRPWTADKTFRRNPKQYPNWEQTFCTEGNNQVIVGNEAYYMSGDGMLMPTKKGQAPPDSRYFEVQQSKK
jgi:hypothetical protein